MYIFTGNVEYIHVTLCNMLCVRLVCESTIEENILKKANQKRILGDLAIESGAFTTDFFKKVRLTL